MELRGGGGSAGLSGSFTDDVNQADFDLLSSGGNDTWTVLPADGIAGIQTALTACSAAGGGKVQLLDGTYSGSSQLVFPDDSNIWLIGSMNTIISSSFATADTEAFTMNHTQVSALNGKACNNTTRGTASVTTTTAGDAASYLAGYSVIIRGNDPDGVRQLEANKIRVSGVGATGVIALERPMRHTLTSVTITAYSEGFNNRLENLDIRFTGTGNQGLGIRRQTGLKVKNVKIDGSSTIKYRGCLSEINIQPNFEDFEVRNVVTKDGSGLSAGFMITDDVEGQYDRVKIYRCGDGTAALPCGWMLDGLFDSTINDPIVSGNTYQGLQFRQAVTLARVVINGGHFTGNGGPGVRIIGSSAVLSDIAFNGCNFSGNVEYGVIAEGVGITFSGCVGERNGYGAMNISTGSKIAVSGCVFRENVDVQLYISGSASKVTVTGCSITDGSSNGIQLNGVSNIRVIGNILTGNTYGIRMINADSCSIAFNDVQSNSTSAIDIDASSDNNDIVYNNATGGTITDAGAGNSLLGNRT